MDIKVCTLGRLYAARDFVQETGHIPENRQEITSYINERITKVEKQTGIGAEPRKISDIEDKLYNLIVTAAEEHEVPIVAYAEGFGIVLAETSNGKSKGECLDILE